MPVGLRYPTLRLPRVCFLLLHVFPWLASRELRRWGACDLQGVRGALGPGRATAAMGRGGHDPDNPLCLTVTTGPARTRAAVVAFGREGEGLQWGGNGGWRGREAGRPCGNLLLAMTRTPSFSLPAFEFALFPSHPGLPLPLFSLPLGCLPSCWRCKTRPCHLQRFRDALPQITGPARQPLGALQPQGAHQAQCPRVPRTRPCSLDAVAPHGAGRSSAGFRGHPHPRQAGHTGRFPVHPGKSPSANVCALAPASAAWIALLFLSGLSFAVDDGERRAGRVSCGGGGG